MDERRREREVTPQKMGGDYVFKTWPGSTTICALTLDDVMDASATLGPDFTVHYFTFGDKVSLALYNGGYPRLSNKRVITRFHAPFGSRNTEWKLTRPETDFRAEAYIPDGDHSVWHAITIAPTERRIREVIGQLRSFTQHDKLIGKPTANKASQGTAGRSPVCFKAFPPAVPAR